MDDILVSDPDSKKASGSDLTSFPGRYYVAYFRAFFTKPNINNNDNNPGNFCHQTAEENI